MIVGFNTTDNELIALREFSPTEYLQGELPESATMPVMAPIPINLALMDPGEDAVNYTLAFGAPEQQRSQPPAVPFKIENSASS